MHIIHRKFVAAVASALIPLLAGCVVGPNYKKPVVPVPPAFTGSSSASQDKTSQNPIAYTDWWKVFHDPVLNDLESQADAANRDIKIAVAHVDEAAAVTKGT